MTLDKLIDDTLLQLANAKSSDEYRDILLGLYDEGYCEGLIP